MMRPTPIQRHSCLRRPILNLAALATGVLLSMGTPEMLSAANPYWDQYGNVPVYVVQDNYGNKQTLKFVDYSNDMLMAEVEMKNPDGTTSVAEVSQPVSETMVKTLSFSLKDMRRANQLIDQENYIGALELMRPEVYPLVKFHQVPESFIQLHVPVRTLIDTLVNAGEYAEAEDLLSRIDLSKVDVKYSQSAIRLMNAYLIDKEFDGSARVAAMIPFGEGYGTNIRPVIDTADQLRAAGKYEEVIPLYRSIEKVVPAESKDNINMWLAYSLVLANRLDEATTLINGIEEPDPKERLFSLYKLLQGSREHRKENYGEALDTLTRGFVRAQTSYSWVPEMLFLIGDCYKEAQDPIAARNVWTEITILYPETLWATQAQSSLEKLPKPEPTTAEQ